jgi:hypothetical protein
MPPDRTCNTLVFEITRERPRARNLHSRALNEWKMKSRHTPHAVYDLDIECRTSIILIGQIDN